jgi:hypothetical protein
LTCNRLDFGVGDTLVFEQLEESWAVLNNINTSHDMIFGGSSNSGSSGNSGSARSSRHDNNSNSITNMNGAIPSLTFNVGAVLPQTPSDIASCIIRVQLAPTTGQLASLMAAAIRTSIPVKGSISPLIDLTTLGNFTSGGLVRRYKVPYTISYEPLARQLMMPTLSSSYCLPSVSSPDILCSSSWMSLQLHFAHLSLWAFQDKYGHLPHLHNTSDARECQTLASELVGQHRARIKGRNDSASPPPSLNGSLSSNSSSSSMNGSESKLMTMNGNNNNGVTEWLDDADLDVVMNTALYARTELPGLTSLLAAVAAGMHCTYGINVCMLSLMMY